MNGYRLILVLCIVVAAALGFGASATIEMTSFPSMSVADGRSTVTISAMVRDLNGKLVPDGTRVLFSTDSGSFRESVVSTQNGIARSILQSGTTPGVAKISASVITYQAKASIDFEFVSDRSLLSSAKDFIEIVAPKDLQYGMDDKTVGASGENRGVVLQYKDIEIRADDVQLNVPLYEVRAKNAILKIGKEEREFGQLYFRLNQRMGFGTTNYRYRPVDIEPMGQSIRFVEGEEVETYGIAEVRPGSVRRPDGQIASSLFNFVDLSTSTTLINAKKAIAYPRKEVQFQKADVYVGGARIMRLPLFKVSLFGQTPVVTDQMLKINDNQVAVDYPYYLSLKPGQTSLLRLNMGQNAGRNIVGNRGIFVNYEYSWNKGDDMQGEVVVNGLGRSDWGISARNYWRLDTSSELSAQLDFPSHRAVYAGLGYSKQFEGYSLTMNASDNRTLRGLASGYRQAVLSLDRDPIKVGKLPVRLTYGLTASMQAQNSLAGNYSQSAYGVRSTARLNPIYFSRQSSLSGSFTVSKLQGRNTPSGLTLMGNLSVSQAFRDGGLMLSYDYIDDGFNSNFLGRHALSARGNANMGGLSFNFFGSRSLDVDRTTVQLDAGYRFARDWRLSYAYTFDRFFGDSFFDYNFILGYRIGYREFGLTWSHRTKRIGFQVLGTTFN
jgi:hypothetical protein